MTPPNHELAELFNKFAGAEVDVKEKMVEYRGQQYPECRLNEDDATVKEMREFASENGLTLRLWTPGSAGTMDFRTDRVNAHIAKEHDGKWRVQPNFNIG